MGVRDSLLSAICQAGYDTGSLDPILCPCIMVRQSRMQVLWLPTCLEHEAGPVSNPLQSIKAGPAVSMAYPLERFPIRCTAQASAAW
jgi:hypothetical protein